MVKGKEIPLEVRREIIDLRMKGKSYREIERVTGVKKSTCYSIVDRLIRTGTCQNAPRSGRRPKFSIRDLRRLEREIAKHSEKPLADIVAASGIDISVRSIQRHRKKSRLRITLRSLRAKPWLDRRMRRQRIKWCRFNRGWNRMDTRNRIWSDETAVKINTFHRTKFWCKIGTKKRLFRPSFPLSNFTLHFWAAITYNERTPLVFVRRRTPEERKHPKDRLGMNADQYINEVPQELRIWAAARMQIHAN